MSGNYLIVDKKILPAYFEKVIEARQLLESGEVHEVNNAVKRVGISRSTYYKYKDYIFAPNESAGGRHAVLSLMLSHKTGVLSCVLNAFSECGANILNVTHAREAKVSDVGACLVTMTLETRNEMHVEQIKSAMQSKGYSLL